MSPGRLDGLYVVVVVAGGASARVRSIDLGGTSVFELYMYHIHAVTKDAEPED